MTRTVCQACAAATDAPLCRTCTVQLVDALKKLPARLADLRTTATRQARIGDLPQRAQTVPSEHVLADAEERNVPARLRSRQGRITLPATVLPVSLGAAELHRQAVRGILSWACAARISARTIAGTCQALAEAGDALRQLEDAGQIHGNAIDLAAWIDLTIDRRDPDVFAGLCDAPGVRVQQDLYAGPPCSGLTCPHESCEHLRTGRTVLRPVAGECGEELNAAPGAATVTCAACGNEYDVAAQTAKLADRMADKLGTVREVAGFLRTLTLTVDGEDRQLEVTVDKVDGWLRRGRITGHGAGPNGKLVKVGEVRAYAEALASRPKSRPRRAG